jgi:phosphomannomutase
MNIDLSIFKSYDIRGIYPTQINEENIEQIIKGVFYFFRKTIPKQGSLTIVLGCDMRLSSPSLFAVARDTLVSLGADVIDIGLSSTPTFYFSVYHYHYDCGIQITASHNPKEYNGLKIVRNTPTGIVKIGKSTGMEEVAKLVRQGVSLIKSTPGSIQVRTDAVRDEVDLALSYFDNPEIAPFTVVADPANAMGGQYIEALFEKIPGKLIKMNFELDGTFPSHPPDPLRFENLENLQARVISEKADFGLAPDGDGDRLFFIDEKGQIVPASHITALIIREMLQKHPGGMVLFDTRYIMTPKAIAEEYKGRYMVTKVGHAFITEQMSQTNAIFAGESSAHYFYRETGNAESQLMTIVCVMKVLSKLNKPLSEVIASLRRSYESGEINFSVNNKEELIAKVKETYQDGEIDELDGISVAYQDWRFNLRASNTEPLIRLNVEARSKEQMEAKRKELIMKIQSLAK